MIILNIENIFRFSPHDHHHHAGDHHDCDLCFRIMAWSIHSWQWRLRLFLSSPRHLWWKNTQLKCLLATPLDNLSNEIYQNRTHTLTHKTGGNSPSGESTKAEASRALLDVLGAWRAPRVRPQVHTSYLYFFLHGHNFWLNFLHAKARKSYQNWFCDKTT